MHYDELFTEKPLPIVGVGAFFIAVVGMEHGHIHGMCAGLVRAGATLKYVCDRDPVRRDRMLAEYPGARAAELSEILSDPEVRLVAAAPEPSERCALGLRVMEAGKDYFVDKAPLITLSELEAARTCVARTGRKYLCYYCERLCSEAAIFGERLIRAGAIGRVVSVISSAPHKLSPATRPAWFFGRTNEILCDLGSHHIEQYLQFSGATAATVLAARSQNLSHSVYPDFSDVGEAFLMGNNGTTLSLHVNWYTPESFPVWGDTRTTVLGTKGSIELRKNMDPDRSPDPAVYLSNADGVRRFEVAGRIGYPFFGALIRDCIDRTEGAMTQAHCFLAAELAVRAKEKAAETV